MNYQLKREGMKKIFDICTVFVFAVLIFAGIGTLRAHASSKTPKTPVEVCDLEISKSVDRAQAENGDYLVYTINFKNKSGKDCKEGVKIQDIADERLTFVSETHTGNINAGYKGSAPYNPSSRMVKWHTTFFRAGDAGTVTWRAKIGVTEEECSVVEIPNSARIGAILGDDEDEWVWTYSNTVKTTVGSTCECRLVISKLVNIANAGNGDVLTYTVNFKNEGDADCTGGGVKIEDTLDSHLVYLSEAHASNVTPGYGSRGVYTASDRIVRFNAGTLNPQESGWFSFNVRVADAPCSGYDVPNRARASAEELNWNWIESNTVSTHIESNDCNQSVLYGSCEASPTSGRVGDGFVFSANATGGNGVFSYSWTGTDGLRGSSRNVNKTYTSAGLKNATVSITSGNTIINKTCTVNIQEPPVVGGNFSAVCSVNQTSGVQGSLFTFNAIPTGGTGYYTYSWTGDDNLIGTSQSVQKGYMTDGRKDATVAVRSGHETITRTCSVDVTHTTTGCSTCGGIGVDQPVAKLTSSKVPTQPEAAFVFLSQIPYTGIDTYGEIFLYFLGVALWSVLAAGYVVYRKTRKLPILKFSRTEAYASGSMATVPMNLPTEARAPQIRAELTLIEKLEQYARENSALVSLGGLNKVIELSGSDEVKAKEILKYVVESYKANDTYDWVTLDEAKVEQSLAVNESPFSRFVSALEQNDVDRIRMFLKEVEKTGMTLKQFAESVVRELDEVYRHRTGVKNSANMHIVERLKEWRHEHIHAVKTAMENSLNSALHTPHVAVKLGILRAAEIIA